MISFAKLVKEKDDEMYKMTLDSVNDEKEKSNSDDDLNALELEDDIMDEEENVVQKKGKKRKREEI